MRSYRRQVTYTLLVTFVLQTMNAPLVCADPILGRISRLFTETHYHGTPPAVCEDGQIELLAENIDWLEHHVDCYGSVVAKQPDIWGEARLTKHRDEYERIMYGELNGFTFKLNAAIAQADSSFLAQAFALSSAATANGGAIPQVTANATDVTAATTGTVVANLKAAPAAGASTFASFEGFEAGGKLGIEPVIELDQRARYLQHLHELRRINEGDDTSDSPGYALNLVRIPISILPGKMTREGFGAEITITATPVLSDDLLPNTFRNLVINDLVDQLGLPIVRSAEQVPQKMEIAIARELLAAAKVSLIDAKNNEINQYEKTFDDVLANHLLRQGLTDSFSKLVVFVTCIDKHSQGIDPKELLLKHVAIKHACIADIAIVENDLALFDALFNAYAEYMQLDDANKELAEVLSLSNLNLLDASLSTYGESNAKDDLVVSGLSRIIFNIKNMAIARSVSDAWSAENSSDHTLDVAEAAEAEVYRQVFAKLSTGQELKGIEIYEQPIANILMTEQSHDNQLQDASPAQIFLNVVGAVLNNSEKQTSNAVSSAPISTGRTRRATNPVPPSQVADVYNADNLSNIAEFFYKTYYGRYVRWAGQPYQPGQVSPEYRVDLLDAQKWLGAELSAAYDFLSQDEHLGIWYEFANPQSGLAAAIRNGHLRNHPQSGETLICPAQYSESESDAVALQFPAYPLNGAVKDLGEPTFRMPASPEPEPMPDHAGATTSETPVPSCYPYNCKTIAQCKTVEEYRHCFFTRICSHPQPNAHYSNGVVERLAWTIVVESALLNQRLNDDIRKTFTAKGCSCSAMSDQDLTFFLPEAAGQQNSQWYQFFYPATQAFQDYVRCRWPIHVFAIDPREQDQNVADVSARKRELQFALAVGFVTGQIGANSLTQYSRDLQTQIETISLNRTVAGFSHGMDTFGWRFYPRVQALDIPGTCGAIKETIFGVSRDCDLHKRQLEPGMRECIAVVLMPSFVPYADFDVRSNWFSLTNPRNSALTMRDSVHLSKAITAMRNSQAQCAVCADCYRPGEVARLIARVEQLDRELPLQSMRAQVPYENTLGGFEMFNTGITDLAPELVGWYGAPGVAICGGNTNCFTCGCTTECVDTEIDKKIAEHIKNAHSGDTPSKPLAAKMAPLSPCEGAGTTLFLVGGNFSVHDTKVIAGGVCIPHVRLISREIMQVTIPSCVNTVSIDNQDYVAVYAATPYGITNHLHVPVHCRCGSDPQQPGNCKACASPPAEKPAEKPTEKPGDKPNEKPAEKGGVERKIEGKIQGEITIGDGQAPQPAPADATTFELIPFPSVEDSFSQVAYMQPPMTTPPTPTLADPNLQLQATADQAMEDMQRIREESIQAIKAAQATAQANVVPAEFIVNVQSAEVQTQSTVKKKSHFAGPLCKQMKTKFRECWHNLRDKLPCY